MTDKTTAMTELPEPDLGYIETDKSRQPAFSARQMREALQSAQPDVPLTPASRAVIMATRTADGDADEWPEPWAYRRGWNDAEAHHGITAQAGGEG